MSHPTIHAVDTIGRGLTLTLFFRDNRLHAHTFLDKDPGFGSLSDSTSYVESFTVTGGTPQALREAAQMMREAAEKVSWFPPSHTPKIAWAEKVEALAGEIEAAAPAEAAR